MPGWNVANVLVGCMNPAALVWHQVQKVQGKQSAQVVLQFRMTICSTVVKFCLVHYFYCFPDNQKHPVT